YSEERSVSHSPVLWAGFARAGDWVKHPAPASGCLFVRRQLAAFASMAVLLLALSAHREARGSEQPVVPASMRRIATVDPRFQSYNSEMVEVTGGRFWKPYAKQESPAQADRELYAYRPPIDLGNAKLRRLTAALSPAYLRVSGTWANSTYFADSDTAPPKP